MSGLAIGGRSNPVRNTLLRRGRVAIQDAAKFRLRHSQAARFWPPTGQAAEPRSVYSFATKCRTSEARSSKAANPCPGALRPRFRLPVRVLHNHREFLRGMGKQHVELPCSFRFPLPALGRFVFAAVDAPIGYEEFIARPKASSAVRLSGIAKIRRTVQLRVPMFQYPRKMAEHDKEQRLSALDSW